MGRAIRFSYSWAVAWALGRWALPKHGFVERTSGLFGRVANIKPAQQVVSETIVKEK